MLTITRATSPDDIAAVKLLLRGLVRHFRDHGEDDIADEAFDHEVGTPTAEFAQPHGRALVLAMIEEARAMGEPVLRLVTVPAFSTALALYKSLGFRRVPQFRPSSAPDAIFMERELTE